MRKNYPPWKSFTLIPREKLEETEIEKSGSQDLRIDLTEIEEGNLIPISKSDEEHRHVKLLIQAPDDEISKDDIRENCYAYIENGQQEIDYAGELINGRAIVIENMLAPVDLLIGEMKIKKGSWIMTLHVRDESLLKELRRGVFVMGEKKVQEI